MYIKIIYKIILILLRWIRYFGKIMNFIDENNLCICYENTIILLMIIFIIFLQFTGCIFRVFWSFLHNLSEGFFMKKTKNQADKN
jgi:hypothetical protein